MPCASLGLRAEPFFDAFLGNIPLHQTAEQAKRQKDPSGLVEEKPPGSQSATTKIGWLQANSLRIGRSQQPRALACKSQLDTHVQFGTKNTRNRPKR